ncbi:MAG: pyridoxamine 5'-phosphate oxidase family protein [Hyphomicrobiales bacterium]
MDAKQVAEELAQPGARALLEQPLLRLAYNGLDGLPRVVPVGFLWTRGRIVVCTATTSPKARALAARPEVAVTIDTGETPGDARSLLIRGKAELETVDGVPEEFIAMSAKGLPPEQVPLFEENVRRMYPQMVRISIVPAWARFYDFGAGRVPRFLMDLAANA